jgi:hypothetical protein
MFIVVGVEQLELLGAMGGIEGVIGIEHDPVRNLWERGTVLVDQRPGHAIEIRAGRKVLEPGHRRLRTQVLAPLRQAPERDLEDRIMTQGIAVVAVLVAGDDRQHPEPDDLGQGVIDLGRVARVVQAAGQTVRQTQAIFDLAEQQQTSVRGQHAPIETDIQRLAVNR